jgi:pentatricopeptide repeat protein
VKDFFISYNQNDRGWAEWIAWTLEENGFSVVIQAWDFVGNWVVKMDSAMRETERTIVVLSPHYVEALFTQPEWADAFRRDPRGAKDLLIPLRVAPVEPRGVLAQIVYVDLLGKNEGQAVELLLNRVRGKRGKPSVRPPFPTSDIAEEKFQRSTTVKPVYPAAPEDTHASRWLKRVGIALVGTGLVATAWLIYPRHARALKSSDTVVLADFVNSSGNPDFDGSALKQGLAAALQQSPFFKLLSDQRASETLTMMGRHSGDPLTEQVARDLCQRTQSKAAIEGSIYKFGSQYAVYLNAIDCQTGQSVAREMAQAPKEEDVLNALGLATTRLRETVGESLSSLQKYDTPLPDITTPSLAALKSYASGKQKAENGDFKDAITSFQRATELDPNFTMAYQFLGVVQRNLRQYALASESLQKAYTLRSKVSEREKFHISGNYYLYGIEDLENASKTYEEWAQEYPHDYEPHTNLGNIYFISGQYDKALEEHLRGQRLNPVGISYSNLVNVYCHLGQLDKADSYYKQALSLNFDTPVLHRDRYSVAFLQNDPAEMQRQVDWSARRIGADDILLSPQSDTQAFSGHLRNARELSRRAVESADKVSAKEPAAMRLMNAALREAQFGNAAEARSQTDEALALASTREVQILAALALAWAGDSERALRMADELEKKNAVSTKTVSYWLPSIRAAVELNRNDPLAAIQILKPAIPYEFGTSNHEVGEMLYPVYLRGQAYLARRQGSDAAVEFQKFVTHKGVVVNCPLGALAYLGLARAYAMQDETTKAKTAYQDFLTLWKDADPDIPILKQAKAEYAKLE